MGKLMRKAARPLDRLVLAAVMSVIVFVLERVMIRSAKKARTSAR